MTVLVLTEAEVQHVLAVEDVIAADLAYSRAVERGLGRTIDL